MYQIKRLTTTPNYPILVGVTRPDAEGQAGPATGFRFYPSGQDGDTADGVDEATARELMEDPGLEGVFSCSPDLPKVDPKDADPEHAKAGSKRRTGKAKAKGRKTSK